MLSAKEQMWLNRIQQAADDPMTIVPDELFGIKTMVKMFIAVRDLQDRVEFLEAEVDWIRFHADKGKVRLNLIPSGNDTF